MKSPQEVDAQLRTRFNRGRASWLQSATGFPIELPLAIPTEREADADIGAVRQWIAGWRERSTTLPDGAITWEVRRWRVYGDQRLPACILVKDADELAGIVGHATQWALAKKRFAALVQRWPEAAPALMRRYEDMVDLSEEDLQRSVAFVEWVRANNRSGMYLRQLPVVGVHTKWVASRTRWLGDLLRAVLPESVATDDFLALCGLTLPPTRGRIRLLCPVLQRQCAGLQDFEAPWRELASLPIAPHSVIIVENLITGLALTPRQGVAAIMGCGYDVRSLGDLPWLRAPGVRVLYWGDIDTHGLAILNRVRHQLPRARSIMMDEPTLLAHRQLWGLEEQPARAEELTLLTATEHGLYDDLRRNRWQVGVRLEQEHLPWPQAEAALTAALEA